MTKLIETRVTIKGGEELFQAMTARGEKFAKKGLRAALYAGSEVLRKAIGSFCTAKRTGFLAEHIGAKTTISSKQEAGITQVGPVRKAFYAGWIEFGRKKQSARPFIRPAFDANKDRALDAFTNKLREIFEDEMSKG